MDTSLAVACAVGVGLVAGSGLTAVVMRTSSTRSTSSVEPSGPALIDRFIADSLPVAFVVLGTGDEVLVSNLMARERQLVAGRDISAEPLRSLVRQARRTRTAVHSDYDDGRRHWRVTVVPIDQERIALLADDRTEARRVDEVRRDFVANVGHELKTPVGALSLLAEATRGAADDPEAVRRFSERIERESARLSRLVQDIIDLSRVQGSDPTARRERVPLDRVVAEAVDRARETAASRRIELVVGDDTGVEVDGDERQLLAAVSNLLDNAVAYSPDETRVAVAVVRAEDHAEVAVTDQGIGIPLAEQDRIFERFYRVDPARSRDTGGTGLGLAIVKHVATAHGGEVTVWSREGSGSTFTVRLPLSTTDQGAPRVLERTES